MKNILVRGPLLSTSGYGEHSRQVFSYVLKKSLEKGHNVYTEILPWGVTPWYLDQDNEIVKEALGRGNSAGIKKFDISFQIQLPNEWDANLADYNIGVTAGVETDDCNSDWKNIHVEKMDKVIVPSEHTKKTLSNNENKEKIFVVPEHYYEEIKDPGDIDLRLSTKFNFLSIGTITGTNVENDRKNLFYMIKWFYEAFKEDNTVGLVIKTNQGRETALDRRRTKSLLNNLLKELGYNGKPKFYFVHGIMNRKEMNALYNHPRIKAYLTMTRGEGFGLPILESAVHGLPVIATNWSAHTEFLNHGKWLKLDYELKEIDSSRVDNQIFIKGSKWASVDENDFKAKIKKVKKSYQVPSRQAKKLSSILAKKYSKDAIFNRYDEVLSELNFD